VVALRSSSGNLALLVAVLVSVTPAAAAQATQATILDVSHQSQVFGEQRFFRIFLPPDYDASSPRRYPVVYFFHGWGERYDQTSVEVGDYQTGYNGDNLSSYVGTHDLIVVIWDGFNPRFAGDTYPRPYNVGPVETYRQFPLYFPELVQYVDSHYRTIADRDHRGVSGVSMGGFMSYWVAGKFPHLVGSASSFMGSPEFFAGPLEAPVEYLHVPMYRNYEGLRTRLVTGTQDFIRWYHRRMNAIWLFTRPLHETEEFVSSHGTPGIAKTLDFHANAFAAPLPAPALWHHADIYPDFDVWGWSVTSDRDRPGFTVLENVSAEGLRSSVREWLPDGRLLPSVALQIHTAAAFTPAQSYQVTDVNVDRGAVTRYQAIADGGGRLSLALDGDRHEVGIAIAPQPILTVNDWRVVGGGVPLDGQTMHLKLAIVNKGSADASAIAVQVQSPNPQVVIQQGALTLPSLAAGAVAEPPEELQLLVQDATREIVELQVRIDSGGRSWTMPLEIPVFPEVAAPTNLVVNDGQIVSMWRGATSKVNQAMGAGNADGQVNPGETISLLYPDGSAYRAGEMFSFDDCVDRSSSDPDGGQYLRWRTSDYWGGYDNVGASVKYSRPIIRSSCPAGHPVTFFVRYVLPNRPEHVLRQGVATVVVGGTDTTPPQPVLARVTGDVVQIDLREGSGVSAATAIFRNGPTTVSVALGDGGAGGDRAAGDAIWSGRITGSATGTYTLDVASTDVLGNSATVRVAGTFALPTTGGSSPTPSATATRTPTPTPTRTATATPTIASTPAPSVMDIDGDGDTDGLTDGLLMVRWMFGFRGDPLVLGVLGAACERCAPAQIEGYLGSIESDLDIDGDGIVSPLTDGVLVLRWTLGFRGQSLVVGAIGSGCARCTSAAIEELLGSSP
jgi:enterochelin esterase-like enzyme